MAPGAVADARVIAIGFPAGIESLIAANAPFERSLSR
jgi:hypothetical protein